MGNTSLLSKAWQCRLAIAAEGILEQKLIEPAETFFQVRVQNCLLRVPPLGHATRLFAFLSKSELTRTFDGTNDCFMGSWTRGFLKDHPTLGGRGVQVLTSLAPVSRVNTAALESRHATVRRLLTVGSCRDTFCSSWSSQPSGNSLSSERGRLGSPQVRPVGAVVRIEAVREPLGKRCKAAPRNAETSKSQLATYVSNLWSRVLSPTCKQSKLGYVDGMSTLLRGASRLWTDFIEPPPPPFPPPSHGEVHKNFTEEANVYNKKKSVGRATCLLARARQRTL